MAEFGGGLDTASAPTDSPDAPIGGAAGGFGSMLKSGASKLGGMLGGPQYVAPDPASSALDQTADLLNQRVKRANEIATNPIAQFFAPDQVRAAREFVPKAVEQLQTIEKQKAGIQSGRQEAANLGLDPGEVSDQATHEDRVIAAQGRALKGDLKAFQGLQARDPKAAEAIQDQVHAAVAANLTTAQAAFDKLSSARGPGEYAAALRELRKGGSLAGLESLGLKVPDKYEAFSAAKGREAEALRNARIGVDTVRQKLEDRNTYQPMEKKEAETYNGRMTTTYGDQITNGTWSRNGAAGTRGLIVNGAADPRGLQKDFALASPEQRKAFAEDMEKAVPKDEREKARAFNRTYQLATHDAKGNPLPEGQVNTNPNVQQGMAEGLASMLRGGSGGANVGLLKIETSKRGFIQGLIDRIETEKGAVLNELKGKDVNPYLSKLTQQQIRDVMDVLQQYNHVSIGNRNEKIAERAGALGLSADDIGYGKNENSVIDAAVERGRQAQIARMTPFHQAIGGGDGVFQIGAQRPGAGATGTPQGTQPTTQLPGAQPLQTPVQQGTNPPTAPTPPGPNTPAAPTASGGPGGGSPNSPPPGSPPAPAPASPAAGVPPSAGAPGGGPSAPPPTGGAAPGRTGVPPGMKLDSPAALDAAANRTIQIESGFKTGSKTGSYVGLGQWSREEMKRHGITDPDDLEQTRAALKTDMRARAAKLERDGLPATAANVYLMHQQGEAGLEAHLRNPDRTAWENVRFGFKSDAIAKQAIWGNMTPEMRKQFPGGVDEVTSGDFTKLWEARYNGSDRTTTGAAAGARMLAGFAAERSMAERERTAPRHVSGTRRDVAAGTTDFTPGARERSSLDLVEHAPAIGSAVGAGVGTLGGPAGIIAGGAAGGGAGQSLKDWLLGNKQNPTEIAKQAALGGVLGVAPAGRPLVGAALRTAGAGAVEGGAKAAEGGDAGDVAEAAVGGAGAAALGEGFGRALGMAGHKVYSLFTEPARKTVRTAAADLHAANEILKTEQPKLPSAAGAAATANPKYEAAQAAKEKAELTLKEMLPNAKADEVAYAHKVSSETVPRQEAEAARPGAREQASVSAGYRQLETDVEKAGVGVPKANQPVPDGPVAAVASKQVSARHAELAERTEAVIKAPAADWRQKWIQLKDARSALLDLERDAQTSTTAGRTTIAKDMRTLADTVRAQQVKAAKYVFGEEGGRAVIRRLEVLDKRNAILMKATNGGDLAAAARMKGEAGREADRTFRAFAHDDPAALAAWGAMRGKGPDVEKDIRTMIGAEKIPVLGHIISAAKLIAGLNQWRAERAAGSAASFEDFVPELKGAGSRTARNVMGSIGARAGVSFTNQSSSAPGQPAAGPEPTNYARTPAQMGGVMLR